MSKRRDELRAVVERDAVQVVDTLQERLLSDSDNQLFAIPSVNVEIAVDLIHSPVRLLHWIVDFRLSSDATPEDAFLGVRLMEPQLFRLRFVERRGFHLASHLLIHQRLEVLPLNVGNSTKRNVPQHVRWINGHLTVK